MAFSRTSCPQNSGGGGKKPSLTPPAGLSAREACPRAPPSRRALGPRQDKGGGAPKGAVRNDSAILTDRGGRLPARQSRRPYGIGPRFSVAAGTSRPPLSQLLAGAPSGPGGWLRHRPGASLRVKPAGAARHPAIKTPHERAPQTDEVMWSVRSLWKAGISQRSTKRCARQGRTRRTRMCRPRVEKARGAEETELLGGVRRSAETY
jgi:hypothetical protein